MSRAWPSAPEFARLMLNTPCFRCGATAGLFCRTDPGGEPKRDPYTGRPAYHQRRLDRFWADTLTGEYHLSERQRFKPQGVRRQRYE